MKKSLLAFTSTVALGIVGMLLDVTIGFDGNFSIVISIAVMGSFIVYNLDNK